ncbi:hypothetical protein [Actinoplanes siamensis]|uniref:Uncharacterized protein n=1 Tax=Actinoplanes siamensis TaxID=1223317 RepID=A0A919NC04_9ACTN|nr:hypothetical protein [Actinoplanes siamensis]GIF08042.1 hypothetical protein Asi03nite_55800 [Actinoplanes siamensis]
MTRLMDEADLETPEVDAAEQATNAVPAWPEEDLDEVPDRTGPAAGNGPMTPAFAEASEWDAEEQNRVVEFDDDYR